MQAITAKIQLSVGENNSDSLARRPTHFVGPFILMILCVTNAAGQETTSLTVSTTSTEATEEATIALAITTGKDGITTLTNSQVACRSYQRGRISKTALRILKNTAHIPDTQLICIPGPESLEGNEAAHAAARALIRPVCPGV